jgi:c-di-GMP-related signal transduction protein
VPGTSFVNLHVSDISLKFVRFLEDHRVDPSIAFEIVENTVLTPTSIKALQSMVRAGYNRIVVDDFPVYTTVGNHGEANLQKLDKAGIVPFAIKLNGKCVREVM